jgi:NIMA (never in mitosis gene a)-related kinase 2
MFPAGRKEKTYLEEVKNVLAPLTKLTLSPEEAVSKAPLSQTEPVTFQTPLTRKVGKCPFDDATAPLGSAMKGVVLTNTGEALATPNPTELAKLFVSSPQVGMNFDKFFDDEYEEEDTEKPLETETTGELEECKPDVFHPPTPSKPERKSTRLTKSSSVSTLKTSSSSSSSSSSSYSSVPARPRPRRTSLIPTSQSRPQIPKTVSRNSSVSPIPQPQRPNKDAVPAPKPATLVAETTKPRLPQTAPVQYDLLDEENLPSPFLKRAEREKLRVGFTAHMKNPLQRKAGRISGTLSGKRRPSETVLRALAAANVANARTEIASKS